MKQCREEKVITEHKHQTLEVSGGREVHQNNISRLLIIWGLLWLLPLLHTSCCTQDLTLSYFLTSSTSWSSSSSSWPSQLTFTVSADPRPRAEHVTQTNRNHNPDWDDSGSVDQRDIKKINRKFILLFFLCLFYGIIWSKVQGSKPYSLFCYLFCLNITTFIFSFFYFKA